MNLRILFFTFLTLLFFSGCSQKVVVRALEPAQVDRMASAKIISVAPFKNDSVGLASKIEVDLASSKIDDENYFTLVSRDNLNNILKEQKLQNSGLMDKDDAVNIGKLIGAQAIVSGQVHQLNSADSYFYEKRLRCLDKKCKQFIYYNISCKKRVVSLDAEVKIVDIEKGDIIYAKTLQQTRSYKHCKDDSKPILSKLQAGQKIATSLAHNFTYKLLPHYRSFEVVLLDDPDINYTDKEEDYLEVALKYIKLQRYDKAEQFLLKLIDATKEKSYVAFYNLGVVKEVEGNYKEAKEYYEEADKLMIEPVEEISTAYLRIKTLIAKKEKVLSQLSKGTK